jgi:hypothetical protein
MNVINSTYIKIIIYCGSDYNKIKKIKCGKGEISDG